MPDTTRPAPRVTREDVAALTTAGHQVIVLDLATDAVTVTADPATIDAPTALVLLTADEALHLAREAHGDLGRLTRIINLDLHTLARAGGIPTADELTLVLAELAQYDAERAA